MLLKKPEKNVTNQKFYIVVAFFYVTAMVTSNTALNWISYSAQVVVKGNTLQNTLIIRRHGDRIPLINSNNE